VVASLSTIGRSGSQRPGVAVEGCSTPWPSSKNRPVGPSDYRSLHLGRGAARSVSSGAVLRAHLSSAPDRHFGDGLFSADGPVLWATCHRSKCRIGARTSTGVTVVGVDPQLLCRALRGDGLSKTCHLTVTSRPRAHGLDRVQSWTPQVEAAADARFTNGSDRVHRDPRSCLCPERAPRPLRTRRRSTPCTASGWRQLSMNSLKRSDRTPTITRDEARPSIDKRNSAIGSDQPRDSWDGNGNGQHVAAAHAARPAFRPTSSSKSAAMCPVSPPSGHRRCESV
jgi:hypothetical protein